MTLVHSIRPLSPVSTAGDAQTGERPAFGLASQSPGRKTAGLWAMGFLALFQVGCAGKAALQKANDELLAANQQSRVFFQELETCRADTQKAGQELTQCKSTLQTREVALDDLKRTTGDLTSDLTETREALAAHRAKLSTQKTISALASSVQQQLQTAIAAGSVEVKAQGAAVVVTISEQALFDAARQELKSEGKTLLEELARVLVSSSTGPIRVEAHTDNQPIKKNPRFSGPWELTAAHSLDVVKFLTGTGVPAARLSATANGDVGPVAPNDTPENQAKNRRIQLSFAP